MASGTKPHRLLLAALLLCGSGLVPGVAQAQELGLDLTDEPAPAKPTKPVARPADRPPPPRDEPSANSQAKQDLGERDVSLADRVKSVAKKPFDKKFHLELTPHAGLSVNDPFIQKYTLGGQATFHLADRFGLSAHFDYIFTNALSTVAVAKRELQSRLPISRPKYGGGLGLQVSPIYGKAEFFDSIAYYDVFFHGGAGLMWSQTSSNETNPDPRLNQGPHPALELGVGQRFHVNRLLAFHWQVLGTFYADTPGGTGPSQVQKQVALQLGLSFFVPPLTAP